jgi:multimeric flavodoxin WrbA
MGGKAMKILAIMGSPRRGESYKLTQMVEQKLKQKPDVEFQYLFLKDCNLGQCVGCHLCILHGEDKCPLKDDRARIEQMMMEADGVIFVSPVYSQMVTTLMKNFIDHFSYLWHRPKFFGKKAMAIATGGGMFNETLKYMEQNAKSWGFHFVNKLGVPHIESLRPKYKEKQLKNIDREVDHFYESVKVNKLPIPALKELMWFNIWKGNSMACKESLPSDYPYWQQKGWYDKNYFYDTKVSLWKRVIMKLFNAMGRWYMKRIYVGY